MTNAEMKRKLFDLARGVSRNGGSLEDFEAALSTSLERFLQDPGVIAAGIKHAYVFANQNWEIVRVEISRAEAVDSEEKCWRCGGTGVDPNGQPCHRCQGTGQAPQPDSS